MSEWRQKQNPPNHAVDPITSGQAMLGAMDPSRPVMRLVESRCSTPRYSCQTP